MNKPRILIIAPAWVGDLVMSQSLLQLIQNKYNNQCQIDVLASSWASELLYRMPQVNQVIEANFKHGKLDLLKRIQIAKDLAHKYTEAYILPNSFKSALIPFFAKIKTRVGYIGEMRYFILNQAYKLDKLKLPLMLDRFNALSNNGHMVDKLIYPQLVTHQNQQLLEHLGLNLQKEIVCFCPGAEYGPAKRWPTAHFATLAKLLIKQGYQIWLLGSEKDQSITNEISDLCTNTDIYNLAGKTRLHHVIDLLSYAKFVITNDTGLMHIAAAINQSTIIAIYGSSSPNFTPPLNKNAIIERFPLECSPCFKRTCKFGHYNCLRFISPQKINTLINQTKGNPNVTTYN